MGLKTGFWPLLTDMIAEKEERRVFQCQSIPCGQSLPMSSRYLTYSQHGQLTPVSKATGITVSEAGESDFMCRWRKRLEGHQISDRRGENKGTVAKGLNYNTIISLCWSPKSSLNTTNAWSRAGTSTLSFSSSCNGKNRGDLKFSNHNKVKKIVFPLQQDQNHNKAL